MFYSQDHIRVTKPLTSNGLNPQVDGDGKIRTKIIHLPLTAKKYLEKKNASLPDHLKMKIEVITASGVQEETKEKKAPGRPKTKSNEEN